MRRTYYFPLAGGLNLNAPALSLAPGELIDCDNYEVATNGGYRRVMGYEPFDGQTAASSLSEGSYATRAAWITAMEAAMDNIDEVPGEGNILGVWYYDDVCYAFRNKTGGASAGMHKSTASGWTEVSTAQLELDFTSGGTSEIEVGDTITGATSSATATVRAVHLTSGTWAGGDAAGTFILSGQTGTFESENINVNSSTNLATISGDSSSVAVTLNPGGRYEFVNYNFGGHSGSIRMYGCDGKNKAFEFDGTNYIEIYTGMTTDTPEHIYAHKKHLFLMFDGGSVQHSPVGDPTGTWSAVTGASEIGLGDVGTGFAGTPGDALAMFGRNSIHILYGDSSNDWVMKPFLSNAGAIEHSIQRLGYPIFLDDYGVTMLQTAEAYGDFRTSALTERVKSLLDSKRTQLVASVTVRDKDQYRLFFDDKTCLTLSFNGGKMIGATTQTLAHQVTCVCSSEDSTGAEKIFFGAENGYVYQMETINSFAKTDINSSLMLAFNSFKSPEQIKRFFKVVLELDVDSNTSLNFLPLFDYGGGLFPSAQQQTATVKDGGALWGEGTWGEFVWGGQYVGEAYGYFDGIGGNISLRISSTSNYEPAQLLQGVLYHYSPRGISR